jgi:hypothetical protein
VLVTLFAPSREPRSSALTLWGLAARRRVRPAPKTGTRVRTRVHSLKSADRPLDEAPAIRLAPEVRRELEVAAGDVVFVDDARWWLGGLRSARCRVAAEPPARAAVSAALPASVLRSQGWRDGQAVVIEVLD